MFRVFGNDPGDLRSILGRVIPKTQKMVLDTSLLYTQYYKKKEKTSKRKDSKGKVTKEKIRSKSIVAKKV